LRDGGAAFGIERGEAGEERGVSAAATQFFFYQREVGPHKSQIEHTETILAVSACCPREKP
jgi:hypothetical protein